jgi:hypothetical protein
MPAYQIARLCQRTINSTVNQDRRRAKRSYQEEIIGALEISTTYYTNQANPKERPQEGPEMLFKIY